MAIKNALVEAVVEGMKDIKGHNISILNLIGVDGASADYFVICEASSNTQVHSIAESVVDHAREDVGERPVHQEGRANAEWILLDYHDVVVHVFLDEKREYYNLEGLWSDAQRTDIPDDY